MLKFYLFLSLCLLFACDKSNQGVEILSKTIFFKQDNIEFKLFVSRIDKGKSFLRVESINNGSDTIKFKYFVPYKIFNFGCGDINNDGYMDVALVVIKRTRFENALRKRLFILSMEDFRFSNLWLSSRMSQPLENFKIVKIDKENYIATIEKEKNDRYLVALYKWRGFGLKYVKYLKRNISLTESYNILEGI